MGERYSPCLNDSANSWRSWASNAHVRSSSRHATTSSAARGRCSSITRAKVAAQLHNCGTGDRSTQKPGQGKMEAARHCAKKNMHVANHDTQTITFSCAFALGFIVMMLACNYF